MRSQCARPVFDRFRQLAKRLLRRPTRPATILVIDHPLEGSEQVASVVRVGGWALARDRVASVEVFVNGEPRLARIKMPRSDVAAALGDSTALASGWLALIRPGDLLQGENEVRVVLHGSKGVAAEATRTFRWRNPESAELSPLLLTVPARDTDSAYLALLGRRPTDSERLMADKRGLLVTVNELARSAEHRELVDRKTPGLFLLSGSEVARTVHPLGTISDDEIGIVGVDGRIELAGGSNDFVSQFEGRYPITDSWLNGWKRVIDRGRERAAAAGVPLAQLIVPEKLSVEPANYPKPLEIRGPRPIEVLLAARPGVLYPLERLRSAQDPAFLPSESHVSPAGARILFDATMEQLGLAPLTTPAELQEYLFAGDLGWQFDPRVFDVGIGPAEAASVEIVDQNVPELMSVGGHIGTYRITRNSAAPHTARVLVFGDSYAKPPPPGVPGAFGDLLSRAFETVHYCWAPFCWDQRIVDETQPDLIVQEICERMVQAVPVLDLDFAALAAITIARKAQVDYDEIFPNDLELGVDGSERLVQRQ